MQKRDLVWLTPQSNFLPVPILFDAPHHELTPETLSSSERSVWFSPFVYPDASLAALGEVLLGEQEPARKELAAFIAKRKALIPYPASDRSDELRALGYLASHSKSREECEKSAPHARGIAASPALQRLACDSVTVRQAFRKELERLSLVFRDTPTPRDQLGAEVTGDLFALGHAQTLLSWPLLGRQLNRVTIGPLPAPPGGPRRPLGPGGSQLRRERAPGASTRPPLSAVPPPLPERR